MEIYIYSSIERGTHTQACTRTEGKVTGTGLVVGLMAR